MKRLFALILSLSMIFALAACGGKPQTQEAAQTAAPAPAEDAAEPENTVGDAAAEPGDATESTGGKTLVVYYSASGMTAAVAQTIADATGAELFELVPVEPYSSEDLNWTNANSRVSVEHDNADQRDVPLTSTTVENWDEYDTVFIGYPIWWGIAAWPVNGFVTANDFSGKTVIPFCTSSSSGLGQSAELLAELAGTGDWQDGARFRSGAAESDIQDWIFGLGLAD